MTKYYKQLNENGKVRALLTYDFEPTITNSSVISITEEEYTDILAEIHEKTNITNLLYRKEIAIDDVPEAWREEIQQRVDKIIAEKGEYAPNEIELKAQAYDILTGAE